MQIGIIGLGLIGGSMAIDLKRRGFASRILGVESDPVNAAAALKMGLADEIIPYEAAASRLSRGVAVVVKEELAEKIGIRTLYDVVKTYRNGHDGFARGLDLEIWLDMRNGARATFRCPEFKINVVNEMRSRIEEAFGKGSFRLIPAPVKQDRQDSRRGQWRRRQN